MIRPYHHLSAHGENRHEGEAGEGVAWRLRGAARILYRLQTPRPDRTKRMSARATVLLNGTLDRRAVAIAFGRGMIRPSKRSQLDPHQLGWRAVPPTGGVTVNFGEVDVLTSDGAVALATIILALREAGGLDSVKCESSSARSWSGSGRLARTPYSEEFAWIRTGGTDVLIPLLRVVDSHSSIDAIRMEVIQAIDRRGRELKLEVSSDVRRVLGNVLKEALLNVHEHAYAATDQVKRAIISFSFCRSSRMKAKDRVNVPDAERWGLENEDRETVQLSVADLGRGVSSTLWINAIEDGLITKDHLSAMQIGTRSGMTVRADVQRKISRHSFEYRSTRKRPADFASEAARLNWRGIHRSLRHTQALMGKIDVVSGDAAEGFAALRGNIIQTSEASIGGCEMPGTTLSISLSASACSAETVDARDTPVSILAIESVLRVGDLRPPSPMEPVQSDSGLPDSESVRIGAVAVLFDFDEESSNQRVFEAIRQVPPDRIPVILFARLTVDVLETLRAITTRAVGAVGGPRLILVWIPGDERLRWMVVGEFPVPSGTEAVYHSLERDGQCDLSGSRSVLIDFAQGMVDAYPKVLTIHEPAQLLRLVHPSVRIDGATLSRLFSRAVEDRWRAGLRDASVIDYGRETGVQLPSRVVTRFVSVLSLLNENPVLAASLAMVVRSLQVDFTVSGESPLVVGDSPSAQTIAWLLQRYARVKVSTSTAEASAPKQPSILLVHSTYTGQSLARVLTQLQLKSAELVAVVVVAVFGDLERTRRICSGVRSELLLPLPFDAGEVSQRPARLLEIDKLTGAPESPEETGASTQVATSADRDEFLRRHPELVTSGYHVINGRVHTVSIATHSAIRQFEGQFVQWIIDALEECARKLEGTNHTSDLVIFTRHGGAVHTVVSRLGEEIAKRTGWRRRVFRANIASVSSGARVIFPSSADELLADVAAVGAMDTLFDRVEPSDGFLGVFLDDAALTGNSLRDFLVKAATLKRTRPKAIAVLLVANRMSPAENRFFDVADRLSRTGEAAPLEYKIGSLFRLQVQSWRAKDESELGELRRLAANPDVIPDARIRGYQASVLRRIDGVATRENKSEVTAHLLCPTKRRGALPVSWRAATIRHLLALYQQNERVLGSMYALIQESVAEADTSLLSMLALEPSLLRLAPIGTGYWAPIQSLCQAALAGRDPAERKSDALLVLALGPTDWIEIAPEVVRSCLASEDLAHQLALHLLETTASEEWRDRVTAILDQPMFDDSSARGRWMSGLLRGSKRLRASLKIDSVEVADSVVLDLIRETWPHADEDSVGFGAWTLLLRDLRPDTVDEAQSKLSVAALLSPCLRFVEEVLLPGLSALSFLAGVRGKRETQVRCRRVLEGAFSAYVALRSAEVASHHGAEVLPQTVIRDWMLLREFTITRTPARFLGEDRREGGVPAIEAIMTELFCAPVGLVSQLAASDGLVVAQEDGLRSKESTVMLVPFDRSVVVRVLRILVENVHEHGAKGSGRVEAGIRPEESGPALVLTMRNKIGTRREGNGVGVSMVRRLAGAAGFQFRVLDTSEAGEYAVELVFPKVTAIGPRDHGGTK